MSPESHSPAARPCTTTMPMPPVKVQSPCVTHHALAGIRARDIGELAFKGRGERDAADEGYLGRGRGQGLRLRPGTTALNVLPPSKNASSVFLEASPRVVQSMVDAGLPEH
jgi:hypothetical protein